MCHKSGQGNIDVVVSDGNKYSVEDKQSDTTLPLKETLCRQAKANASV